MKRTFTILILALAACAACMPETSVMPSRERLVLGAPHMAAVKAPVTGTAFPSSRTMVVSAWSSAASATYFSGLTFAHDADAGGWQASSPVFWPVDGTLDFLAYSCPGLSPVVSWASPDATAGITAFTTGDNGTVQDDILFGAAAGCAHAPSSLPSLSFVHGLAQVAFTAACPDMAYDASANTGVTVEGITLASARYGGTAVVTRSGGAVTVTWPSLGNAAEKAVDGIVSQGLTQQQEGLGTGVLLPPQEAVSFTVAYTVHAGPGADDARTYTFDATGTWAAGVRHVYAIEIAAGGGVTVMPGVEEWADTAKDWLYADGNAVRHLGSAFSLAAGQPVYWRPGGSGAYERLTYVSGTYGAEVTYEAAAYFVTVAHAGDTWTVTCVPKDRVEYEYRLSLTKTAEKVYYGVPYRVDTYLQRRERTWESGVAGPWSGWGDQGRLENLGWTITGTDCAEISGTGEVDLTKMPSAEHDATFATSWTSYLGGAEVTLSGSVAVTIAKAIRYADFGGIMICPAPLYHDGTAFMVKDYDWHHPNFHDGDPRLSGKVAGSYYFNFVELGTQFSSQGAAFDVNSGDIDNGGTLLAYEDYDDWRMPTSAEWQMLLDGTGRSGSTVNGTTNVYCALIHVRGTYIAYCETATGVLVFPEGLTIEGAPLSVVNNTSTRRGYSILEEEDLKYYLSQGCAFLPACGTNDVGTWRYQDDVQPTGQMWSATGYGNSVAAYDILFRGDEGSLWTSHYDQKTKYWCVTRLVRTIH